ncbi:hypothetical protein ABT370_33310, partial [Streptomyces rubradiris]
MTQPPDQPPQGGFGAPQEAPQDQPPGPGGFGAPQPPPAQGGFGAPQPPQTAPAQGGFGDTQSVDFDALSGAGLFLLHGPTG